MNINKIPPINIKYIIIGNQGLPVDVYTTLKAAILIIIKVTLIFTGFPFCILYNVAVLAATIPTMVIFLSLIIKFQFWILKNIEKIVCFLFLFFYRSLNFLLFFWEKTCLSSFLGVDDNYFNLKLPSLGFNLLRR